MANQLTVENVQSDMSVEESHNQDMIDLVEEKEIVPPGMEPQDKFGGDYNKLMESYQQLEQKLGQPQEEEYVAEESDLSIPQSPDDGAFDMAALQQEYMSTGSLGDKSYQQLEDAGISRQYADTYIAGVKALGEQIGNNVKSSVGGDAEYSNMVEWAKANYNQDQIQAYDKAVNSGDVNTAIMAAKGLRSDYTNTAGSEGTTYGGTQAEPEGSGEVFRSNAEVTTAMKDKRYEYDTAYRQDVLNKLERSDIFSQGRL
jgi:hypothetical protein